MPVGSGKKRLQKRMAMQPGLRRCLCRQQTMSRQMAIKRVRQLLCTGNAICSESLALITLFHMEMDELTEAGVPYEMVRALEKRYPHVLPGN